MSVFVAVPWRNSGERERGMAHRHVHAFFRSIGLDAVDVDSPTGPWSLSAARNAGVRLAEQAGADVVVVCDADNWPQVEPLNAAIDACRDTGMVHLPYTRFVNGSFVWDASWGGIYVSTPAAWWFVGGQDPRFTGWGCEDHAMLYAHAAIHGCPPPRHEGTLTHWPHPSPPEKDPEHPNAHRTAALLRRYIDAADDKAAMRALLEEFTP